MTSFVLLLLFKEILLLLEIFISKSDLPPVPDSRDCPGLELTAPVADEILTGTLSVPVCEFSKKREKISEKN